MQKQQYLQGLLQQAFKNTNIYQVFCNAHAKTAIFIRFSAKNMQKQQYLQGFLQKKTTTTVFTRFSATRMQKQQYLQGFLRT